MEAHCQSASERRRDSWSRRLPGIVAFKLRSFDVALTADYDAERGDETKSCAYQGNSAETRGGRGKRAAAGTDAGLTV